MRYLLTVADILMFLTAHVELLPLYLYAILNLELTADSGMLKLTSMKLLLKLDIGISCQVVEVTSPVKLVV